MRKAVRYFTDHYRSPLGGITLTADEVGLTGLRFDGSSCEPSLSDDTSLLDGVHYEQGLPALTMARRWLDAYFAGRVPDLEVPLHLVGTAFQLEVWQILLTIPYSKTRTYGDIARELAEARGTAHMSAQAVGSAVSRNPVALIVPCHRVIGAHQRLGGYAGGIGRKLALFQLEGIDTDTLSIRA